MTDRVRRWGWLGEGFESKRAVEYPAALDDTRDRQGAVRHHLRQNRARAVEDPDCDDRTSDQDARTVPFRSAWRRVRSHASAGDPGQASRFVSGASDREHERRHDPIQRCTA